MVHSDGKPTISNSPVIRGPIPEECDCRECEVGRDYFADPITESQAWADYESSNSPVDLKAVAECDGYPALAAYKLILVDEQTILMGVSLGLMRLSEPGVHEFTPRGHFWFTAWLLDQRDSQR